ncbi:MAG: hypothetical protein Kow0013_19890 [Pararhodobacter sp.]
MPQLPRALAALILLTSGLGAPTALVAQRVCDHAHPTCPEGQHRDSATGACTLPPSS